MARKLTEDRPTYYVSAKVNGKGKLVLRSTTEVTPWRFDDEAAAEKALLNILTAAKSGKLTFDCWDVRAGTAVWDQETDGEMRVKTDAGWAWTKKAKDVMDRELAAFLLGNKNARKVAFGLGYHGAVYVSLGRGTKAAKKAAKPAKPAIDLY